MKERNDVIFYEAGWQGTKFRLISAILIPAGLFALAYTYWIYTALPDVDGNLEPLGARIALGTLVLVVGLLCAPGVFIYLQIYPMRLAWDRTEPDHVLVETSTIIGTRRFLIALERFGASRSHSGEFHARSSVHTPFMTVKIAGWRFPMIIDCQATVFNQNVLEQVLRAAARKRKSRKA